VLLVVAVVPVRYLLAAATEPPGQKKEPAHIAPSELPPFFGIFGSADLIAKVGFRGDVGSYIEFQLDAGNPAARGATGLRLAQVGPPVAGARWIEMITIGGKGDGSGIRMLSRGLERGNVERLLAGAASLPATELPLDAMSADLPIAQPGGEAGSTLLSDVKHLGSETVEVPLGKFKTEHWLVARTPKSMEIWTTTDPKVPFTGAVKMLTRDGLAVARKVGTDATATILPAPGAGDGN
jgi:hypothetical protein